MIIFKLIGKITLFILGIILLLVLAVNLTGTRADIVAGITGNKIKLIKPGMTLEQVISILGRPFRIDASRGLHKIECKNPRPRLDMDVNNSTDIRETVNKVYNDTSFCCEGNREDMQNRELTLTFTRPVTFCKNYPMLWVHFDNDFKVFGVYIKRYERFWKLDDPAIYWNYWEAVVDTTLKDLRFTNKIDYFIDEKKFDECFD